MSIVICVSGTNNVITKKTINNKIPLHPGLRLSLFPGVPPYILFHAHDKKGILLILRSD